VFGYSDEDGTEAAGLDGKLDEAEVRSRVERLSALAEELVAQRADDRLGERVEVLVEEAAPGGRAAEGRAAPQAPEVDGATTVHGADLAVGSIVGATVVATVGADLVARVAGGVPAGAGAVA
jgi:tRNA A37 methylthiotransferase MiaB